MNKPRFEQCINCMPPKRHPGCQDSCEDYKKNKAKLDRLNEQKRAGKVDRSSRGFYFDWNIKRGKK